MKKFLFWTALASVALTGCVKNDAEPNPSLGEDVEITFNQPVVGKVTRANFYGEIDTDYEPTEAFAVTAWAHMKDFSASDNAEIKDYMKNVKAVYKDDAHATVTTPPISDDLGTGGWGLDPVYYWPKTHKLTFSAYSPYNFPVTSADVTVSDGITLTEVKTPTNVAEHYDLLYSNRVYNQTERVYTHGNNNYKGVDIVFNHAFASVHVQAKLDQVYGANNSIQINSIHFDNVYFQGSFSENVGGNKLLVDSRTTSTWYNQSENNVDFYIGTNNLTLTNAAQKYGTTAMFIPQDINHDGNTQLVVNYTITNTAGIPLNETLTFDLSAFTAAKWEKGKRYIYTLTFGLNEIYLAPSVVDWDPVDVGFNDQIGSI